MPSERLFEIRIGVYATEDAVTRIVDGCERLLDSHALPYRFSVAAEQVVELDDMPLAEFYDDLPQQWRIQHPGADSGSRSVHELRVGLLTSRPRMDVLRDELTRVLCPDPEHDSPCPIPWAAGYTDGEDEAAHLERRYGHLRQR